MSELHLVHRQPEWALARPIAANPLPFSPNCTPPRNFLQPYADPPHAGCPAEYIPSMYPFPENTIGNTCPMQRATPCVQPMPCNIQPVPNTNALQCCAKSNPHYGSAVYRQESLSDSQQLPPQQQVPSSSNVLNHSNGMVTNNAYRQSQVMDNEQYDTMLILLHAQANRLRITEYILIALVVLIVVALIFMKK